jgi:hypothetical protein
MKKLIKKIKVLALFSLVIAVFFLFLVKIQIISLPCTVQYLNPWQYFFKCLFYYGYIAIILFVAIFLIMLLTWHFAVGRKKSLIKLKHENTWN